jgi:hypothetical protein
MNDLKAWFEAGWISYIPQLMGERNDVGLVGLKKQITKYVI